MQYAVCLHFPDNHLRTLPFGGPTLRAALWAAIAYNSTRYHPLDWSVRLLALGADATEAQLSASLDEVMALEPGTSWSKRAVTAEDHIHASREIVRLHLRQKAQRILDEGFDPDSDADEARHWEAVRAIGE